MFALLFLLIIASAALTHSLMAGITTIVIFMSICLNVANSWRTYTQHEYSQLNLRYNGVRLWTWKMLTMAMQNTKNPTEDHDCTLREWERERNCFAHFCRCCCHNSVVVVVDAALCYVRVCIFKRERVWRLNTHHP